MIIYGNPVYTCTVQWQNWFSYILLIVSFLICWWFLRCLYHCSNPQKSERIGGNGHSFNNYHNSIVIHHKIFSDSTYKYKCSCFDSSYSTVTRTYMFMTHIFIIPVICKILFSGSFANLFEIPVSFYGNAFVISFRVSFPESHRC